MSDKHIGHLQIAYFPQNKKTHFTVTQNKRQIVLVSSWTLISYTLEHI